MTNVTDGNKLHSQSAVLHFPSRKVCCFTQVLHEALLLLIQNPVGKVRRWRNVEAAFAAARLRGASTRWTHKISCSKHLLGISHVEEINLILCDTCQIN